MRLRVIAAALVVASLGIAASTAGASSSRQHAGSITVWLQVDAQSGWPDVVQAANQQFESQHPGVKVNVEYQTWGAHLTKLDASLAGGTAPDVVEMGNTEMTKYMAAGAFADLTAQKAQFPNSKTWLKGLLKSSTFGGKLYGVPYYAATRSVIYRKDYFNAAGVKTLPTSLAQFMVDGKKLMTKYGKSDSSFSAFYLAGRDWYSGISFVYDFGGQIARTAKGKWIGTLNTPRSLAGLNAAKQVFTSLSRASSATDEAHPFPTTPFAQGHAASFIGPAWQYNYALDPKAGDPALAPVMNTFALPSHVKGKTMGQFVGGSDLAIPATADKALAIDWVKAFTDTASETALAKAGNIPNTTVLAAVAKSNPKLAPNFAAAENGWFVPLSKNWTNVENANVLQNMFTNIYSGKQSVKAAATAASKQITQILNAST